MSTMEMIQEGEMFLDGRYAVGKRDGFEVTEDYTYFDYSHEELLAAVHAGESVAVGTLVVSEEVGQNRFAMHEVGVLLDPSRGGWVIAKMFDGYDAAEWERAAQLRDAVVVMLSEVLGTREIPLELAAVVLGAKTSDVLVPERLEGLVFGEDGLVGMHRALSGTLAESESGLRLCETIGEVADFIDAKLADEPAMPRWLSDDLARCGMS